MEPAKNMTLGTFLDARKLTQGEMIPLKASDTDEEIAIVPMLMIESRNTGSLTSPKRKQARS